MMALFAMLTLGAAGPILDGRFLVINDVVRGAWSQLMNQDAHSGTRWRASLSGEPGRSAESLALHRSTRTSEAAR
jgi:hypothetical protein